MLKANFGDDPLRDIEIFDSSPICRKLPMEYASIEH